MFHEDGDDDVDENKLRDEDEYDKVDRCYDRIDAAVTYTVDRRVTVTTQSVLYSRPSTTQQSYIATQSFACYTLAS